MPSRYVAKLRGPVAVVASARLGHPSWHVDPRCKGLERTPEEARTTRTFPDVTALGLSEEGRLCRMCTLEPVLRSTLRPRRGRHAGRNLVTFSSQPSDDWPFTGYVPPTPSGERRVRRLARVLGLHVLRTGSGTVATGMIDPTGKQILARNLRNYDLGDMDGTHDPASIETFWTLVTDTCTDPQDARELWQTARLLNR